MAKSIEGIHPRADRSAGRGAELEARRAARAEPALPFPAVPPPSGSDARLCDGYRSLGGGAGAQRAEPRGAQGNSSGADHAASPSQARAA